MKIGIIESNTTFNVNELRVSKICEDNKAQVETFLSGLSPHYEINSLDNAFICYIRNDSDIQIRGLFAFSNNNIKEEYIATMPQNKVHYTEITHCVADARLLTGSSLSDCLKKILPDIVNCSDIDSDEAIWFDYEHILYARKIDSVFKTVKEYYFLNEAEYFSDKIIGCCLRNVHRLRDISNKMKNALK